MPYVPSATNSPLVLRRARSRESWKGSEKAPRTKRRLQKSTVIKRESRNGSAKIPRDTREILSAHPRSPPPTPRRSNTRGPAPHQDQYVWNGLFEHTLVEAPHQRHYVYHGPPCGCDRRMGACLLRLAWAALWKDPESIGKVPKGP